MMKAAVLMACALLSIGMGLISLTMRPDRVAAQSVKIEPGKKTTPKPAAPTPTPREPIGNRTPRRAAPKIEMVLVRGGSFLMGSPENEPGRRANEGPQRRVSVRSFYMGKYEITQAQWRALMGGNPSRYKGDDLPVETVSWDEAKDFCRKLSQMTGEEYRLPTEAEWEYACRARTTGAHAGDLNAIAWYGENSDRRTHPVGRKKPNAWGLYDMHGNVWEWCEDDIHFTYENAPSGGRAWVDKPTRALARVIRGCDRSNNAQDCRSANREDASPGARDESYGFRIVRTYR
jgi:formylglycine-generating enzyme required for sulfatase activity